MSDAYELGRGYRCWMGYRMLFSEKKKLKLDSELVPIIKVPSLDTNKSMAMQLNIKRVLRKTHPDLHPLFFVSLAIWNKGDIPYPFDSLSDNQIDRIQRGVLQQLEFLSVFDKEYASIEGLSLNHDDLIDLILSDDVSVAAASRYAVEKNVERIDFGFSTIARDRMETVFEMTTYLEEKHQFFTKHHLLAKRIIERRDSMAK